MANCLLSSKLQTDILKALSVFQPHAMTTEQYLSCFSDVDEYIMLANVEDLIRKGEIHHEAIRNCAGEKFISLARLRLLDREH